MPRGFSLSPEAQLSPVQPRLLRRSLTPREEPPFPSPPPIAQSSSPPRNNNGCPVPATVAAQQMVISDVDAGAEPSLERMENGFSTQDFQLEVRGVQMNLSPQQSPQLRPNPTQIVDFASFMSSEAPSRDGNESDAIVNNNNNRINSENGDFPLPSPLLSHRPQLIAVSRAHLTQNQLPAPMLPIDLGELPPLPPMPPSFAREMPSPHPGHSTANQPEGLPAFTPPQFPLQPFPPQPTQVVVPPWVGSQTPVSSDHRLMPTPQPPGRMTMGGTGVHTPNVAPEFDEDDLPPLPPTLAPSLSRDPSFLADAVGFRSVSEEEEARAFGYIPVTHNATQDDEEKETSEEKESKDENLDESKDDILDSSSVKRIWEVEDIGTWNAPQEEKDRMAEQLSERLLFSKSFCLAVLVMVGGNKEEALRWIGKYGAEHTPSKGQDITIYPSVVAALGFRSAKNGHYFDIRPDSMAVEDDFQYGCGVLGQIWNSKKENEALLRYSDAEDHPQDTARFSSPEEASFSKWGLAGELQPLAVLCDSDTHFNIFALVCPRCLYTEFPGCTTHAHLLTCAKSNGHAKCRRCPAATDLMPPWSNGCRRCRHTRVLRRRWAMTLREAQYLLRAFPPDLRSNEHDTAELAMLYCPECGVTGFPGVGGDSPSLCVKKEGSYFALASSGQLLDPAAFQRAMAHLPNCTRGNKKPLCVEACRITYGEAQYLYRTAQNVDSPAQYWSYVRGIHHNALAVVAEDSGGIDSLQSQVIGTIYDPEENGEVKDKCASKVTLRMLNPETGVVSFRSFPSSEVKVFSRLYGVDLDKEAHPFHTLCNSVRTLLHATLPGRARAALVPILRSLAAARENLASGVTDHNSVGAGALSPESFGISDWSMLVDLYKITWACEKLSMERKQETTPSGLGLASNQDVSSPSTTKASQSSQLWEVVLEVICQQKRQENTLLYSPLEESFVLSGASSLLSLAQGTNDTDEPLRREQEYVYQRESLHPFFSPSTFGEELVLPADAGGNGIRVCFDNRTCLGRDSPDNEQASLLFWASKEDALQGKSPVYQVKSGTTEVSGYHSFVIPNSDRLFYLFQTLGGQSRDAQQWARSLRLEATNHTGGEYQLHCPGNLIDNVRCFPSLATTEVLLTKGKWYYEVTLVKAGLAQVGWADATFVGRSSQGNGCGDDLHSWAYDGLRACKWHNTGVEWGKKWTEGDVVGVMIDLETKSIAYSLNGSLAPPMGTAFQDIAYVDGLRPCVTLNSTASIRVNFGETPLHHLPEGFKEVCLAARLTTAQIKKNWGYLFRASAFTQLQVRPVCDFSAIWSPRRRLNAPPPKRSSTGAVNQATLWRPNIPPGCAILGDVFSFTKQPPCASVVVVDDGSPILARPLSYEKLWHQTDLNAPFHGAVWRPRAPPGFVALGDVYTKTGTPPMRNLIRCVHKDCVSPASILSQLRMAQATKSSRDQKYSSEPEPFELWSINNQLRTFIFQPGLQHNPLKKDSSFPHKNAWQLKHFSFNTTHLVWETEQAVFTDGSVFWATWVLSQLQSAAELPKQPSTPSSLPHQLRLLSPVLSPLFPQLLECLTSMMCTPTVKEKVADMMIQLLHSHTAKQFKDLDIGPLHQLSKKIVNLSWDTKKEAQLILPRPLMRLLELALKTFSLEERAGILKGTSGYSECAFTTHQDLWSPTEPMQLGPDDLAPMLVQTAEMIDYFLAFKTHRLDPCNIPLIPLNQKIIRAWLDTAAFMSCKQYFHEKRLVKNKGKYRGETIEFPGAESLEVVFDRRSSLKKGATLKLRVVSDTSCGSPGDSSSGKRTQPKLKGKTWKFDCPLDDRKWEMRPCFNGHRLRFSFKLEGGVETIPEDVGFAFTVVAHGVPMHLKRQKFRSVLRRESEYFELVNAFEDWTLEMDALLVEWVNEHCSSIGVSPLALSPLDLRPSTKEFDFRFKPLAGHAMPVLSFRLKLIQEFNRHLQRLLPVVDLLGTDPMGLGFKLRSLAYLIFKEIKDQFLECSKQRTQGTGGSATTITLDNFLATRSSDVNNPDIAKSKCIFVQAFHALKGKDARILRSCWDGDRVFQVTFKGEKGSDAGGLFRDAMSQIVEDLFTAKVDLFIPCPNAQHEVYLNTDKFIPNPRYKEDEMGISMMGFVGRLIGVSLRAQLCLPFRFPPALWKHLVGEQINFNEDVLGYDALVVQLVKGLRKCKDKDTFDDVYADTLHFVCTVCDGKEVELVSQGSQRIVTFQNKEEYCCLVESHRAQEFDVQLNALARGMAEIIPRCAVSLFTWHELEKLVCGSPDFDIDFWREHTTYRGYSEEDLTIQLFWKVLGSFDSEEQEGFVRFAWGRSRLPPKGSWYKDMHISRRNTGEDSLPVSHTCFFSIELPPYLSEEKMRHGLQTAIHFGVGGILNT